MPAEPPPPRDTRPQPSEHEFGFLAGTVYDELRAIAARQLSAERVGHTLDPTALVHEAYLRLQPVIDTAGMDRKHLVSLVSRTMRRVLVDHARARLAAKRPSSRLRVTLAEGVRVTDRGFEDVLDLHLLLERYARVDERAARVAEMLMFGGFTQLEVAEHLGVSERTVRNDFTVARAWMQRELVEGGGE